jgi:pimeloyl-ACP methyl ester carboxylesterase
MRTRRGNASWLEAGAGWPVVLLHAFPLDASMWQPQLEAVPEGWRFIAPHLRRFEDGLDGCAADVFDLLNCLELEEAVIGGLSMGGYLAFAMYRQAPSRFSGLLLADTRAQADTPDGRAGREKMRALLARDGPPAVADQMLPKLLSPLGRAEGSPLAVRVREMIERNDPAALDAAILAMMNRADATPLLPQISCPTLVLAGELDEVTPVADAEPMQRAIQRSRLTVIRDAGHLSNLEQPVPFSRALVDFLLANL